MKKSIIYGDVFNHFFLGFLFVLLVGTAHAQVCSYPLPFDDSLVPPISPRPSIESANISFWVFGARSQLDASEVSRNGDQILIVTHITREEFTLPSEPANCFAISLGSFGPGSYVITERRFSRSLTGAYTLTPLILGPYPSFVVAPKPLPAPALSLGGMIILIVLAATTGALMVRRAVQLDDR